MSNGLWFAIGVVTGLAACINIILAARLYAQKEVGK